MKTRGSYPSVFGCRNTEILISTKLISGVSQVEISRYVKTGSLAPGFSLGAETPKPVYIAKLISGFHKSGFRDWRVQGNLPLGIPGVETNQNLFTLYHFGVSHIGISQLANTRKLTLGIPGCRNAETSKSIHALSFRGFSYRGFRNWRIQGN
jgi:hypothetical protein